MHVSKKYLHDKLILSLLSIILFLALVCIVLVLLRYGAGGSTSGYIVQFRANLGISAFKTGSLASILSFPLFAVGVSALSVILSIKVFALRRQLALTVLGLTILLLVLAIIVSNALLVLR